MKRPKEVPLKNEKEQEATRGQAKKRYVAPQLIVHGTVDKITKTAGMAGADVPLGGIVLY